MAEVAVDALRCPECGAHVVWTCSDRRGPIDGGSGHAHCAFGYWASSTGTETTKPCGWAGARLYRRADGSVWTLDAEVTRFVDTDREFARRRAVRAVRRLSPR